MKGRRADDYLNRDVACEPVTSREQCHITVRKKDRDRKSRGRGEDAR